jgi:tetratricopeptide (TPR) repeat protein
MRSSIASGLTAIPGHAGGSIVRFALVWALLLVPLAGLDGVAWGQRTTAESTTAPSSLIPDAQDASLPPPGGEAQQSDPRRANTAVEQATRLRREGKTDDALKVLDVALEKSPRDPRLRFLYGVILAERGRSRDAIGVFEQMTQDFPELPEPYNNLAVMYAAAGELDAARTALENAVRALPGYALAQENLGDVYVRMAARAYEQASKLDPGGTTAPEKLKLARELMKTIAPKPAATRP